MRDIIMNEKEAMQAVNRLVGKEMYLSMVFSEVSQFSKEGTPDDVVIDAGNYSDLVPNFPLVLKKMNDLLRINTLDELIDTLIDGLATAWAFQLILCGQTIDDYKASLKGRLSKARILNGWTDEEYEQAKKEVKKLVMFIEHNRNFLARIQANREKENERIANDIKAEADKSKKGKKNGKSRDPSIA